MKLKKRIALIALLVVGFMLFALNGISNTCPKDKLSEKCQDACNSFSMVLNGTFDCSWDLENDEIWYIIIQRSDSPCPSLIFPKLTQSECQESESYWSKGQFGVPIKIVQSCTKSKTIEIFYHWMEFMGCLNTCPAVKKYKRSKPKTENCSSRYNVKILISQYDLGKCSAGSGYKVRLRAKVYNSRGKEVKHAVNWSLSAAFDNELSDDSGHRLVVTGPQTAEFVASGNSFGSIDVFATVADCVDSKGKSHDVDTFESISVNAGGFITCHDGQSFCLKTIRATTVRSGPSSKSKVLFRLPAGMPVNELETKGVWIKIETYGGKKKGWVHKNSLKRLAHQKTK